MKKSLVLAACAAAMLSATTPAAFAGPIENACNRSDRAKASRSLCNCIQQVADMTLNRGDQRRIGKFFNDPDEAHATWVSQRASDDAFWERYKSFGNMAEAYCGG